MTAPQAPPLRTGPDSVAATLRRVFETAGFLERPLCERLVISALDGVDVPLFKTLVGRLAAGGLLELFARVFVFGEAVPREALRAHLSNDELEAFVASDLLRAGDDAGLSEDSLFAPIRLVPVDRPHHSGPSLWVVGDRSDHPNGTRFVPFDDIVFSGHNPLTRQFLRLLPENDCGDVLDLCSGTGVAALVMAPRAVRCTAADIAERSVHFARFNGWLNGCEMIDVVSGDLYEPVAGRTFDRIVAHPPYVPALTDRLIYRDGGETGEHIIRRVVEGAGEHLNPGGSFHLLCLGMDTADATFEQRVRNWLGDRGREFDIVFALDSRTPPEVIASRLVERAAGSIQDLERWRDIFQSLQVKEFVYGAIVGRRIEAQGADTFTRRVMLTDESRGSDFEWLFRWFDWLRKPDLDTRVLTLTPTLAADLRLEVGHGVEQGVFAPSTYALVNGSRPFFSKLETEAWVVALLNGFDGARTVQEAFRGAVERGRVPAGFGEAELVRLMCFLLERRCLECWAVTPPERA